MTIVRAALLLVVTAAFGAVGLFWWILKRREAESRSLPPLLIPISPKGSVSYNGRVSLNGSVSLNGTVSQNGSHPPGNAEMTRPLAPERVIPGVPLRPPLADAPLSVDNIHEPSDEVLSTTDTIRFRRPVDEPVQFLPGRLEVLAGTTRHREILFVRVPGMPAHLILGREAGPAPHYIGLDSPTVSRRHARFSYADGKWLVKNLSQTNPLVVNDEELSESDSERPLADGDRLELGEVVLRFHAQ